MLDLNNLYWEEKQNINNIYQIASEQWGENVEFEKIKVINSPYPEFELPMKLYGRVNILLAYDRSALDIGIPQNGQYVLMSEFTDKPFVRGMKATQVENLRHNFQVLDEVARKLIASGRV